jgi:hypothetical protein
MGSKADHKERIKELEEISSAVQDTGEEVTYDKAEFERAVLYGQIQENISWTKVESGKAEVYTPSQMKSDEGVEQSLREINQRISGMQDAGYMPKMKPLLYYLDFLKMELDRFKAQFEAETDPQKLEALQVFIYKTEAKIEMTVDWLKAQDKAGDWGSMTLGDRGHEVTLPKFGSKAEVEEAIKNRHLPAHGETPEEMIAGRIDRYRKDTERITQGIDVQNKQDKSVTAAGDTTLFEMGDEDES